MELYFSMKLKSQQRLPTTFYRLCCLKSSNSLFFMSILNYQMATLIIHPDDPTTDFLKPIYQHVKNATLLTRDVSQIELKGHLGSHKNFIFLGHGSGEGLFNKAGIGKSLFTINETHVPLLRNKNGIYIWCNADQFVQEHQLQGFYSGMFISQLIQAQLMGVLTDQESVQESNNYFAEVLGQSIKRFGMNTKALYEEVKQKYQFLGKQNVVAAYNSQLLYFCD